MTTLFYSDLQSNYFLSNFYPQPFKKGGKWKPLNFIYENQTWPTSEHLYQALKFKNDTIHEKEWRELLRTAPTPGISRYLGHFYTQSYYSWQKKYSDLVKKYSNLVRLNGDITNPLFKIEIMCVALKAKFSIPELKQQLLDTNITKIGEDSTDLFWGINGQNNLGKILMALRFSFKKES